jgi:large subunit ribosomal protein L1
MAKHGKAYEKAAALVDRTTAYSLAEASALVKKTAPAKFDETIECNLRMGVDPRNAQQQVRGVALLPAGLGKKVRVLVFAQADGQKLAREAGADYYGGDELIEKISAEQWMDFDVAIATPDMMGKVGKLGKILGRKGLMPNPKSGTVVAVSDIARAVDDARKGRVEYKLDRTAIIHCPIGKVSFTAEQIAENLSTLLDAIIKSKPSGLKGAYIKSVSISSTMGPGIFIDLKQIGGTN